MMREAWGVRYTRCVRYTKCVRWESRGRKSQPEGGSRDATGERRQGKAVDGRIDV